MTPPAGPDLAGVLRLGILGGSFDPPHAGHLHVARAATEAFDLDHVVFVPAARPPHKLDRTLTDGRHRLAMVERLIAGEPRWSACDLELDREGPSYTVDTVEQLPERLGLSADARLFLLIGGDNLRGFPRWYRAGDLVDRAQPVVITRGEVPAADLAALAELGPERVERIERGLLRLPEVDVSSTDLRAALERGGGPRSRDSPRSPGIRARGRHLHSPTMILQLSTALAASFGAACLLARLAPRLGWVDRGTEPHKLQTSPVPAVGGAAILIGLLAAWAVSGWRLPETGLHALLPSTAPVVFAIVPALAVAFLVGLADDLLPAGLPPLQKLAGQLAAGATLVAPVLFDPSTEPAVLGLAALLVLGAVVAQNAINTFDNADGTATTLSLAAISLPLPIVGASLLGVLPLNLRRRSGESFGLALPRSYLGDAGSHLLGMLVLVTPLAWPILALPLFDLARLCIVRVRAGRAPWQGDRRHLAHRLADRGLSPLAVVAVMLLVASPTVVTIAQGAGVGRTLLAVAFTGLLFAIAVVASRDPRAPDDGRRLGGRTPALRPESSSAQ